MAQLLVRNLENEVVDKLRVRAAQNGVSMEEEHRRILRASLLAPKAKPRKSLKELLLEMPDPGDDFPPLRSPDRKVEF